MMMMMNDFIKFIILFFSLLLSSFSTIPLSLAVTCPMDLSYVLTIPWDTSSCRNHATNVSSSSPLNDPCCNTLLSLYGIAFAQRLKDTNFFMLPDLDTSVSCLQSFTSKLEALDIHNDISSFCLAPHHFVISENNCASIKNVADLVSRLDRSPELTELISSCRSNLRDHSNCTSCITSTYLVKDKLLELDGEDNSDDSLARECYFFTILYAAGIINSLDPSNRGVLTCILSLPINTRGDSRWQVKLGIGAAAVGGTAFVMSLAFFFITRYRRKQKPTAYVVSRSISSQYSSRMDYERGGEYYGLPIFEYDELRSATNNFDPEKELGDGGFGTVFYGKLKDGRVVAVKRLYENNYKRTEQFMNEVEILARLHHPNLVRLYGCTSRMSNRLLLVYEYVPNGTVADHLHGDLAKPGSLPWSIRMNIAVETASALVYLHASEIIHRDVKTNNILLDENFKVKVADFGLSRLFPLNATHVSTAPQGTPGYVDPEYHECYQLTEKSDVYSFGVVLMELISSLPAVDIMRHRHEINLSTMAINKIQNDAIHELVDKNLGFGSDDNATRMILAIAELGFQCLQNGKDMRPSMAEVLEVLQNIQKDKVEQIKDVHSDVAALLKVDSSPVSVTAKWVSSENTTPNLSG